MSAALRNGDHGACLRGTLPPADELTVGAALELTVTAEARAECQAARAEELVSIFDALNTAWENYANARR